MRFRTIICGLSMLPLLTGCAVLPGLDFLTGSESSNPAQVENKPAGNRFRVGDHYTFDNPITRWRVVAIDGEQVSWRSNNGDRQVTGFNPLLPARRWWSQRDGDGRRMIRDRKGALFPMKVGAAMSFRATVTSTKPPFGWEYTWSCRVTGRETVTMMDQSFETFVVVCGREDPNELTFNYAPKVGHYVVQRVAATADSPARTRRLLAYERAATSAAAGPVAALKKPPSKPADPSTNVAAPQKKATPEDNLRPLGRASSGALESRGGAPAAASIQNAVDSVSLQSPDFGGDFAPAPRKAVSGKARSPRMAGTKPVARKPTVTPPRRVPNPATPKATAPPVPKPVARARVPVPPPLAGPRIGASAPRNFKSRLVPPPPPIRPTSDNTPPAVPAPRSPPAATAATAGDGSRVAAAAPAGVHLASYRAAANARQGWDLLARRNGDLLRGLRADIRRVDIGEKGIYYRLYAVPLASASAALELCRKLRQRGVFCEPENS